MSDTHYCKGHSHETEGLLYPEEDIAETSVRFSIRADKIKKETFHCSVFKLFLCTHQGPIRTFSGVGCSFRLFSATLRW